MNLSQLSTLSQYTKNIISVAFGTILSQLIPIITAPILTRIYTPADYGIFGLYMSIVSIMVTLASARFDLAIFLPKNPEDSKRIFVLTILISSVFSFLLFFLILAIRHYIVISYNLKGLDSWLLTIPFAVIVITLFQNYLLWLNRVKYYRDLNFLKILNSLILTSLNLLFGYFNFKSLGLILGLLVSYSIMTVLYIKNVIIFFKLNNLNRLRILIRRYKNFPLYTLPSTLSGEIGSQLPTVLLIYYFDEAIAGFFILATRMISLPFSILGNSIGIVYRQEAIEKYNLDGNCKVIYKKTFKKLLLISIPLLLIIMFGSEWLFSFCFGTSWIIAGKMASYLSLLVFFQLLSTPMADTILFVDGQKVDLFLQVFRLFFTALSFVAGGVYQNYQLAVILYTTTYCVYYASHSLIQYRIASGSKLIVF